MALQRLITAIEEPLFRFRVPIIVLFGVITVLLGFSAANLQVDAGFEKRLPTNHPYIETFRDYRDNFGSSNRILIAVRARDGDMFTPGFFETLKGVTDAVYLLEGVDPSRVSSIFTPNVRFIEVVEDGFAGGNVIPATFQGTPEDLETVRENILKSGQVGRLVANDFSAAMVSASLVDHDPSTGEPIDYLAVADRLETDIRERFASDAVDIHIIGFAKVMGDVADGAMGVALFFLIAFLITGVLIYLYCHSLLMTGIMLACSLTAVIWQLGLLSLFGYGIDPMSIIVPFLVFAIGVSHGVQIINAAGMAAVDGLSPLESARQSFRRMIVPGAVALASDTIGFLTILLIDIPIIKELAIAASIGVGVIIVTNLILLPLLIPFMRNSETYRGKLQQAMTWKRPVWAALSAVASPRPAAAIVLIAGLIFGTGWLIARDVPIGDLQAGVPELRPDSRYNQDTALIVERFSIGIDQMQIIAEGPADGCIDYGVISTVDDFEWHLRNVEGVQSTISLANVMRTINAGWNEGHPAWAVLPRNSQVLVRASRPVETSTGLLNADCSAMPVLVFAEDHRAETIDRIVAAAEAYRAQQEADPDGAEVNFRLAIGNMGIMAAANDVVASGQTPILLWVYGAVTLLCLLLFRSVAATLCTILPLMLVSVLAYALMTFLGIGLKVTTLPVVALGVGIGVDYGIYIFSRLQHYLGQGLALRLAYEQTLRETGSAVIFTGLTLAVGVSTWIFSALQFQADMGLLLAFMFLLNMAGAVILLPALACMMQTLLPTLWSPKETSGAATPRTAASAPAS